jgi:hypothetical protein
MTQVGLLLELLCLSLLYLLLLLQSGSQLLQLVFGLRLPFCQLVAAAPQGLQLCLGGLQLRGSLSLLSLELLLQFPNALLGSLLLFSALLDLGFQLGNALLLFLLAGLMVGNLLQRLFDQELLLLPLLLQLRF